MDGLLDSRTALRRLKMRHGLRVSEAVNVSNYILACKLKRALQDEFTDRLWKEIRTRRTSRNDKINKLTNRINKLPGAAVKALYEVYEKAGIRGLVMNLNRPIAVLLKMSRKSEKPNGAELGAV